jgi:hypothetical protein
MCVSEFGLGEEWGGVMRACLSECGGRKDKVERISGKRIRGVFERGGLRES